MKSLRIYSPIFFLNDTVGKVSQLGKGLLFYPQNAGRITHSCNLITGQRQIDSWKVPVRDSVCVYVF